MNSVCEVAHKANSTQGPTMPGGPQDAGSWVNLDAAFKRNATEESAFKRNVMDLAIIPQWHKKLCRVCLKRRFDEICLVGFS